MTWDWGEYGESEKDMVLWQWIQKAEVDYSKAKTATLRAIASCDD